MNMNKKLNILKLVCISKFNRMISKTELKEAGIGPQSAKYK